MALDMHLKSFYFCSPGNHLWSQTNKTFLLCFLPVLLNCLSIHTFLMKKKSYKLWLAESVFVLPLFSQICCAVSKYNPFQNALNIMHIIQLLAYKTNMNYCILQKVLSTLQPSLISLIVLNSHDSSQNFTSTSYSFIKTSLSGFHI